MKKLKLFLLLTILIFCFTYGVGCKKHTHDYQFYIISEPTCNTEGKVEGICSCGEKIENSIIASHKRNELGVCSLCNEIIDLSNHTHKWAWQMIAKGTCTSSGLRVAHCACGIAINETLEKQHNMRDTICINCGYGYVEISNGQTYGYTANELINKLEKFGYSVNSLTNCYIYDLKFDSLNVLHASVCDSTNVATLSFINQKTDFDIITPQDIEFINRLAITDYNRKFNVILADGTSVDYGYIEGLSNRYQDEQEPKVKSIFINQNNLLLIVYTNNTVKIAGKIATTKENINGGQLIYQLEDNCYRVIGTLDDNLTKIKIPDTHRGLPVKKVGQYAFSNNEKITEVVFGSNIETVEIGAFENCKNLEKLTFNNNLKRIYYYAFKNIKLKNVVIPSSVNYIADYSFGGTNFKQKIFLLVTAFPSLEYTSFNNVDIYYANQWKYVNGVPTVK